MAEGTSIGQAVRSLRLDRGLTQEALAARIGCATSRISDIERDRHDTQLRRLREVAAALGVHVSRLIEGEASVDLTTDNNAPQGAATPGGASKEGDTQDVTVPETGP